ncbi:MAG TPA: GNAT family N-acetyltransferase [Dehalococcoidia bacterium]|nr:GNAT family N-acetyltransferase [Dehalococcoidia bacterium]
MNPRIRPISASDRTALLRILKNTPEFKSYEVSVAEEVIDSCLDGKEKSGYFILVAEDNKEVIGFVCYGPTPLTVGTWDIYWEAVSRNNRGQGIGGALLKAAEKDIRKSKGRLVLIETSSTPAYAKTRQFYIGHGYEEIARVLDFYEPGDDRVILRKLFG